MASELAEPGLQPDWDVQQVAVADRMLNRARPAERSDVRRKFDDRLAQRVIDAEALDRGFTRRHDLELPPAHALPDGNRVAVLAGAAPIDVAWLDLADADDVRAELEALVLEVACCFLRRGECLPRGRNRAGKARLLVLANPPQDIVDFRRTRLPAAGRLVPVLPGE